MRLIRLVALTIAAFVAVNAIVFYGGVYRRYVIDPESSTGAFERAVTSLQDWPADRRRDVLVVGDSRMYAGFDPRLADGHGLRFLNGGIPGTNPRTWFFFLREIDPAASRFRALVIPVDSYADDTSAIGSLDADDHAPDVRAIVFATTLADIPAVASSFDEPSLQRDVAFNMLLRGPVLRDDLQALLADPPARFAARARADPAAYDPRATHPFATDLTGLHVDFARNAIGAPPWVPASERAELDRQILRVPEPSASYAAYRMRWLGPIVSRYGATGTPVVFVRIPARPVHRTDPVEAPGSLGALARRFLGVAFVSPAAYLALERPELFADHDHLNRAGNRLFSTLLGGDVARILGGAAGAMIPSSPTQIAAEATSLHARAHQVLADAGAGTPMLFQSIDYALFLACVLAACFVLPRRGRPVLLLVASYYFYLRWNAWYVVFLLFLTASDFLIALRIDAMRGAGKRALLALGVALNLAFLASFKYLNFATGTLFALLGKRSDPWLLALVVPVGISFHTFQSISYLVDVGRGRLRATRKPADYALYLAFFPQLLAGPIVRAERFLGELRDWRAPDADRVERGLREIVLGLVKKLVIADQFAPVADAYFANPTVQPSATAAWCATFAFAVQIYFDFSGYSDIAIGSARLLGFDFPDNFRRPYLAASITEFWRRWHISLSTWLRDYVYVPLGGNRAGGVATYRNVMVTMLLGGLWHGANWTFVAWGAYQGALLVAERALKARDGASGGAVVRVSRAILTFGLVALGWVLFRAQSFGDAFATYRAMVTGGLGPMTLPPWPLGVVALAVAVGVAQERGTHWDWRRRPLVLQAATLTTLLFAVELASWPGAREPFVYFKF